MSKRRKKRTVAAEPPLEAELQRFSSDMPRAMLFNLDTIAKNGLLGAGKSRKQLIVDAVEEYLDAHGFPTEEQMEVLVKF